METGTLCGTFIETDDATGLAQKYPARARRRTVAADGVLSLGPAVCVSFEEMGFDRSEATRRKLVQRDLYLIFRIFEAVE